MGSHQHLKVRSDARNGVARLELNGEIDFDSAGALTNELLRVEWDGVDAIIVDLRDVTFIDSSGLHAFVQARRRAAMNGHSVVLVGATQPTRRVFELAGTDSLLDDPSPRVLGRFANGMTGGDSDEEARSVAVRFAIAPNHENPREAS